MFKKLIITLTAAFVANTAACQTVSDKPIQSCDTVAKEFHELALKDAYMPAARQLMTPDILLMVYTNKEGEARGGMYIRNNAAVPPTPPEVEIYAEDKCLYEGKEVRAIFFRIKNKVIVGE